MWLELERSEPDRSRWTAAVESRISQSARAEGVFHYEISAVQANRREWPYAGCQASLASLREKGAVPSAWFLQARATRRHGAKNKTNRRADNAGGAGFALAAAKVFKAFGRLDALVNNAGVTLRKPALEVTVGEWETVMQTNVRGTFFLCQKVGRRWVKQGAPGCIINIASAHGVVGFPNRSVCGQSGSRVSSAAGCSHRRVDRAHGAAPRTKSGSSV